MDINDKSSVTSTDMYDELEHAEDIGDVIPEGRGEEREK